jgi:hypothetical protein
LGISVNLAGFGVAEVGGGGRLESGEGGKNSWILTRDSNENVVKGRGRMKLKMGRVNGRHWGMKGD